MKVTIDNYQRWGNTIKDAIRGWRIRKQDLDNEALGRVNKFRAKLQRYLPFLKIPPITDPKELKDELSPLDDYFFDLRVLDNDHRVIGYLNVALFKLEYGEIRQIHLTMKDVTTVEFYCNLYRKQEEKSNGSTNSK